MPKSNFVANAVDWYVNKINTMHLLPANVAALIRDVASKQIGDENFRPRPLTADNFTDEENAALYRLAYGSERNSDPKAITSNSYDDINGKSFNYGKSDASAKEYFSPLRVVSTTLGSAGVKKDSSTGKWHVVDTYDFNKDRARYLLNEDGTVTDGIDTWKSFDDFRKSLDRRPHTLYGLVRRNAGLFGHTDEDPDASKIKANISLDEIKGRLGEKLWGIDIHRMPSKSTFVTRSALGGGLLGAPVGAAIGAVAGLIQLANKENRKKWLRTMLTNMAASAAIASVAGAAGVGYGASKAYDALDSKKVMSKIGQDKSRSRIKERLLQLISYAVPLMAIGGLAYPAITKSRNVIDGIKDPEKDTSSLIELEEVPEDDRYMLTYGGR